MHMFHTLLGFDGNVITIADSSDYSSRVYVLNEELLVFSSNGKEVVQCGIVKGNCIIELTRVNW